MLTSYGNPTWMGLRREVPVGAIMAALEDPLASGATDRMATPLSEGRWEILRLVAAGKPYKTTDFGRSG